MLKLLHTADLHLSGGVDLDYSLTVLSEIETLTAEFGIQAVLLCGDIFDTYKDLLALKDHLRQFAQRVSVPVLYIPGNHEELGRPNGALWSELDLSPVRFLTNLPYQHENVNLSGSDFVSTLEVLAIPHQNSVQALHDSLPVPARTSTHPRIVLAHGFVHGMAFFQKDEEEGGTVFDASFFGKLDCHYVALGHVHGKRLQNFDGYTAAYPGSPRVWRRGENGPRSINVVSINAKPPHAVQISEKPLTSAGEYRLFEVEVDEIDSLNTADITCGPHECNPHDYIEFKVRGVVDHEFQEKEIVTKIKQAFEPKVRKLAVNTKDVIILDELVKDPLARKFLEKWAQARPQQAIGTHDPSYKAWLSARDQFLSELKRQHAALRSG